VVGYNIKMTSFPNLDMLPEYKTLRDSQPKIDNQDFLPQTINNIFFKEEQDYIFSIIDKYPKKNIRVQKWGGQGILDNIPITNKIKNKIEKICSDIVGEELVLAEYSIARYSSEYGYEVKLFPHYDTRPIEMFILDIQLKTNEDWGIIVEGQQFNIKDNDAILFSGTQQMHWREKKSLSDNTEIYMMFCWLKHKKEKILNSDHDIIMKMRESVLMKETNINSEERLFSNE
jgi:hypothetical protein